MRGAFLNNLLPEWLWIGLFGVAPFAIKYLLRVFPWRLEEPFSAEGVFDHLQHIHLEHKIGSNDASWQSEEMGLVCCLAVYFEDGRMCIIRDLCHLNIKKGQKIRVSKNRRGTYSVTEIS